MALPLALNEIRTRAGGFIRDWQGSAGDERQEANQFIRDLLAVYGITKTRAAFYEKRTKRSSTGRQGYIDALIPGVAVIEMKSATVKDLAEAEKQALDYIDDLPKNETPRYVLTSNFKKLRLLDLEAPAGEDVFEFDLVEFVVNADRLRFFAGYTMKAATRAEQEAASIKAAKLMASLYEAWNILVMMTMKPAFFWFGRCFACLLMMLAFGSGTCFSSSYSTAPARTVAT